MSISSNSKLKALHMGGANDSSRSIVLASHPPKFLAFGEGHLQPAVAAGNGAFDRTFLGISPILQRKGKEGVPGWAQDVQRQLFSWLRCGEILHTGSSGHRLAHWKGLLNAENAVRTTGLLTAGRNP